MDNQRITDGWRTWQRRETGTRADTVHNTGQINQIQPTQAVFGNEGRFFNA
jgi:hypothetical protein